MPQGNPPRSTRMTDAQRSVYRTIESDEPLILTFSNKGAQELLEATRRANWTDDAGTESGSASDSFDDDYYDIRDRAYDFDARLRDIGEVFVNLDLQRGSHGEPIYVVAVQVPGLEGYLRLSVAAKDDCALVIGVRLNFFAPPTEAVRWVGPFFLSRDSEPLPEELRAACRRKRDSRAIREDVERNIEVWEKFLEVEEQDARKRQFYVQYVARRTGDQPEIQRLTLAGASSEMIERVRNSRDFLEVFVNAPGDLEDSNWDNPIAKVRVLKYQSDSRILDVRIDEDDPERVIRAANRMPDSGYVANRELGTTVNISRQKKAIERLRHGHARLASLDQLLYGAGNLNLSSAPDVKPLPLDRCLRPDRINDEQRLAVSMALSTPDCFFLQGPPGTGKTTFIAELCFQAARDGMRVLVSSQTNLAVDNALSRLENQPEILATRLGNLKSIDDDGLPFVGERAVQRWLSAVAERTRTNIKKLQAAKLAYQDAQEHLQALTKWASRGSPQYPGSSDAIPELAASVEVVRQAIYQAAAARSELGRARDAASSLLTLRGERDLKKVDCEEIGKALADGIRREASGLLPAQVSELLGRLQALHDAADSKDRTRVPSTGPLPGILRAYVSAERSGSGAEAEKHVQQVENCMRRLRRKASGFFFGWLHRGALLEAQQQLRETVQQLADEITRPGIPWLHLRQAVEQRHQEAKERLASTDRLIAEREQELSSLVGTAASSALMQAAKAIERVGGDSVTGNILERFEPALESLQGTAEEREDQLACAVWQQLYRACVVSQASPCGQEPAALLEAQRGKSWQLDPARVEAGAHLLTEWSSFLSGSLDNIDTQLQTAFDQAVNVVGATCSMTASKQFLNRFQQFDIVIVDEVSKATATELLLPTLLGRKVILVGDHKQLHPMIGDDIEGDSYQDAAATLGLDPQEFAAILERSLFKERFEHLAGLADSRRTMMLPRQYRMHSTIMQGVNQFYEGRLQLGTPDLDLAKRHDLHEVAWLPKNCHVVWIDLPDHPDWYSEQEPGSKSSINPKEAEVVGRAATQLLGPIQARGMSLGIISLYAGQARLIRREVDKHRVPQGVRQKTALRVSTVDRFQGTERDVVIVSLCANGRRPSGFLRTPNRINVAMSRAKRLLVIVGSSATFCRHLGEHSHYGAFLRIARTHRGYVHAQAILATN